MAAFRYPCRASIAMSSPRARGSHPPCWGRRTPDRVRHTSPGLTSLVVRPTDLALLRTPGVPTVSPDGRIAVVAVSRPDLDGDEYRGQLWAVPTDGSAPARPLTSGGPDPAPAFSPGGRWLASLSAASSERP